MQVHPATKLAKIFSGAGVFVGVGEITRGTRLKLPHSPMLTTKNFFFLLVKFFN